MARDAVQVTTVHLRHLAARNMDAATELDAAADLVCDVDGRIRSSHGVIAHPTAAAIEALRQARRTTAERLSGQAHALSDNLSAAARRYADTDRESAGHLAHQLRPH